MLLQEVEIYRFRDGCRWYAAFPRQGRFCQVGERTFNILGRMGNCRQLGADCIEGFGNEASRLLENGAARIHELPGIVANGFLEPYKDTTRREEGSVEGDKFTLTIAPCEDCNFACRYCFARHAREGKTAPARLRREVLDCALDVLFSQCVRPGGRADLGILGGEPLLDKELLRTTILRYVERREKETFVEEGDVSLTTNASLLDEDTLHFLAKHKTILAISYDGPAEIHDGQRVFRGGQNSHAIVRGKIKLAQEVYREYGLPVTLHAVLLPQTREPERIIEDALELEADRFIMQPAKPFCQGGEGFSSADVESHLHQYRRLYGYLLKRSVSGNHDAVRMLWTNGDAMMGKIRRLLRNEKTIGHRCDSGTSAFSVSGDGTIYPCQFFATNKMWEFGHVVTHDLTELKRFFRSRTIDSLPLCQDCWARHWCGGSCPWISEKAFGDSTKPYAPVCELSRYLIQMSIMFVCAMDSKYPGLLQQWERG